jgi:hypothetical protein
VLPRFIAKQVFFVGAVFGAGVGITIVGYVQNVESLKWAWPVSLIALLVNGYFLRRGEKKALDFIS